jgi:hypothetical protein
MSRQDRGDQSYSGKKQQTDYPIEDDERSSVRPASAASSIWACVWLRDECAVAPKAAGDNLIVGLRRRLASSI